MMKMKVSVILCTYSPTRYNDTLEALKSLKDQTYDNIEIILIIDSNIELYNRFCNDNELKKYTNLKIGLSQLKGLSNARNKGITLSTGNIIAFIDDDAIADKNWIFQIIKDYSDPHVIGVGGIIKPYWIGGITEWIPEEFYWTMGCSYKGQNLFKHYTRSNFGSNMSFRKEVFDYVGLFDNQFGLFGDEMRTGEETEFSIRALNTINNSKIVFDPDSIVFHRIYSFRKSLKFILKRCLSYGTAISHIGHLKNRIENKLGSTESSFIRYLFRYSYAERIIGLFTFQKSKKNFTNLIALTFFSFAVIIGFIFGKLGIAINKS